MSTQAEPQLRRVLGFWALTAYGVGDILGAGIYALVGEIAAVAGGSTWLSFSLALGVAALTAFSYAELGSRFPRSGSEPFFCRQAFGRPAFSLWVGWLVFSSAVVSIATVSRAFAGYLQGILPWIAEFWLLAGFLTALAGISFSGMRQSSMANILCTLVEGSGLLLVVAVGWAFLPGGGREASAPLPAAAGDAWLAIARGGALAFYAFIGFEDMVNVAEEVRSPKVTLPTAIITAMTIAAGLYILVARVATAVVPAAELAGSEAPLLEVVRRAAPALPEGLFTMVALFAVANTGLLNFVTGSRLLYGISRQRLLPAWLGRIHPGRRTPHGSILTVFAVALVLASSGTLADLAGTTSFLLLLVFLTVNLSLVVIKRRDVAPREGFRVPSIVPLAGASSCLVLMAFVPRVALWTALLIGLLGLGIVRLRRRDFAAMNADSRRL